MMAGLRLLVCLLAVAVFYIGATTAASVDNEISLSACLLGAYSVCTIPANTVINFTTAVAISQNVTLEGSGNSVVDLMSSTLLATVNAGVLLNISNVEIRNGLFSTASCVYANTGSVLYMTDVVIRNMSSTSGAAIYQTGTASQGQGRIKRVQFIDCSTAQAATSALRLADPIDWIIEDVSFVGCSGAGVSNSYYAMTIEQTLPLTARATFGGNLSFVAASGTTPAYAGLFFNTNTAYPFSDIGMVISSKSNNPSTFYISGFNTGLMLRAVSGPVIFEAHQITHVAPFSSASSALQTQGPYSTDVTFLSSLVVDKAGIVLATVGGTVTLNVLGGIYSTNSIAAYAIRAQDSLIINTLEIIATNVSPRFLVTSVSPVTVRTTNDFLITGTSGIKLYPAMELSNSANFEIGGTFAIRGFRSSQSSSGAAISAIAGFLNITAQDILFANCQSGNGGAILAADGASVRLAAKNSVLFRNNTASGSGGALYLNPGASFSMDSPIISFTENTASVGAALLLVNTSHLSAFATSNFEANMAYSDCLVALVGSNAPCTAFNTSGTVSGTMTNRTASSCSLNDHFCIAPVLPAVPESIPASVGCLSSAPSYGSWNCENGQWVSVGSITTESVTIPPSTVIVKGNLTLTGTVIFTGLDSSISIEGGCAYIDGKLQVTLTPEELEAISKESGGSRSVILVSQSSNCTTNLAISVDSSKSSKSCRKVSSTSSESTDGSRSSLVAIFRVDSSSCNTRWIILGGVLGGVLLITLVLALVFVLHPKARALIRPFSARNGQTAGK